ncbi:MAG: hypothetical protein P4L28_11970 [Paludibacteraceae bacterium]|nr:hypothetical protein [Paludibacteraceae bacterium]
MTKQKKEPQKKKKHVNYTISKKCAFSAESGTVNDSIGRIMYTYKSTNKIYLENLSTSANQALLTSKVNIAVDVNAKETVANDCFYNILSKKSIYTVQGLDANKNVVDFKVTDPTINVFKIKVPDNSSVVPILEVRTNDTWILQGVDSAPYEHFKSVAITKAEATNVKMLVSSNNFLGSPVYCDLAILPSLNYKGQRLYYKATLNIVGTVKSSGNSSSIKPTGITVYSLDKNNWFSAAYSTAAFDKISGYVWDNSIVPNPIGTNPFRAYWSNGSTGLKDVLKIIIRQASPLSTTDTSKGARLLNTSIRDYLYAGNIEKVTFEMAFRLPFFIENAQAIPYTIITDSANNKKTNNPYISMFDTWLTYANNIRTAAGYASTALLTKAGQRQSFSTSVMNNQDHNTLYNLFGISKTNNASFANQKVPAYMAKVMEDENPKSTFLSKKKNIVHFPANVNKTIKTTTYSISSLSDLASQGLISYASASYLQSAPVNSFAKILNGSQARGYYLVKSSDSSLFILNNIIAANNSGCTIGMGFDMGQHTFAEFTTYTRFNITNSTDNAVFQEAIKKHRHQAAALYKSYANTVFPKYPIDYDFAVQQTMPFMKTSYLKVGLDNNGASNYFKVQGSKTNYFYNTSSTPYLNEVEKMVFLSQLYNGGANILKSSTRSKLIIHAFNTHDYRWLKYFTRKDDGKKIIKGLAVYPSRKTAIIKLMETELAYNHYNIQQTSL